MFPRTEAPNNAAEWQIAFTSKGLKSTEPHYSNTKWEALVILHGLENFHHYCFTQEVSLITGHKPPGSNIQDGCYNPITQATMLLRINTPIEHKNNLQVLATAIHCRLAIQMQPWDKLRPRNPRHVHLKIRHCHKNNREAMGFCRSWHHYHL